MKAERSKETDPRSSLMVLTKATPYSMVLIVSQLYDTATLFGYHNQTDMSRC